MSLRSKEWDPQTTEGKSGASTRDRGPKRVATEKLLSEVYMVLLEVTFKATGWWLSGKGVSASNQSETLNDHVHPLQSGCWSYAIHTLITWLLMCWSRLHHVSLLLRDRLRHMSSNSMKLPIAGAQICHLLRSCPRCLSHLRLLLSVRAKPSGTVRVTLNKLFSSSEIPISSLEKENTVIVPI